MSISSTLKDMVWDKYVGKNIGISNCYLNCGNQIRQSNFECGHIISRKDGGPLSLNNLRPICSKCNKSMSTKNMILFVNTNDLYKCPLYFNNFDETKINKYIKQIVYSDTFSNKLTYDDLKNMVIQLENKNKQLQIENNNLKKINEEYINLFNYIDIILNDISSFFKKSFINFI